MGVTVEDPDPLDRIDHLRQTGAASERRDRSPAFKETNLLLQEAARFHHDPGLVLIFEKHPNAQDPLCLDPLIIVRRSFLLEVASCIQAATLGAFAILLTMEASKKELKVGYI